MAALRRVAPWPDTNAFSQRRRIRVRRCGRRRVHIIGRALADWRLGPRRRGHAIRPCGNSSTGIVALRPSRRRNNTLWSTPARSTSPTTTGGIFNRRRRPYSSARRTICPTTSGGSATGATRDGSSPRIASPGTNRIDEILLRRQQGQYFKDPLSLEYVLVEDHRRSVRFERECPNPVWWFDYTKQEKGPRGSSILHTETPNVQVERSGWVRDGQLPPDDPAHAHRPRRCLTMPWQFGICPRSFRAIARRSAPTRRSSSSLGTANREYRLMLFFDLKPDAELTVSLLD